VRVAGEFDANVTWMESNIVLEMYIYDNPNTEGDPFATSSRTTNTTARLLVQLAPKRYGMLLCHGDASCVNAAGTASPPCDATFNLSVKHP